MTATSENGGQAAEKLRAPYGRCPGCNQPLPDPWTPECKHRRACEARQMLHDGAPVNVAAAHAQRLGEPRSER